jgi:hypothetical protein
MKDGLRPRVRNSEFLRISVRAVERAGANPIRTVRKDDKAADGRKSHAKQTSAVVPHPLTMADKSPRLPL